MSVRSLSGMPGVRRVPSSRDCAKYPDADVLDLGATKHEHEPGTSFRVFLDPAGHPFFLCVD
jgi:hypothetical protein